VGKAVARKKRVAAISGYFQLFLAILGVVEVLRRFFGNGEEPTFQLMITISIISLIGNTVSLILLQRSKNQEVHMQASKIFTSNDVIINLSVIVAGILVYMTGTNIPDLVVGGGVFLIVASGAFRILSLSK
jgi:Co/Zn/Cd efflux system component